MKDHFRAGCRAARWTWNSFTPNQRKLILSGGSVGAGLGFAVMLTSLVHAAVPLEACLHQAALVGAVYGGVFALGTSMAITVLGR